jgi:flagellar biosynthesis protein FliR
MDLQPLIERFSEQQVAAFMLVLARISPLFLLAPLFSSRSVPARAKSVAAIGLTIGMLPVAAGAGDGLAELPVDAIGLAGLIFKELLVGAAFAFVLAALFAAISAAGALLDTMIGFSFGAVVDPITGGTGAVLGQLYSLVGIAVFIAIGGDAWVVQGIARTYDLVPLLEAPELGPLVAGSVEAFAGVFTAAVQVSAPVLLAVIITDAGIGVVSRVMPSLNVFAVGFPAKVAVGLLLIGTSLPFTAGWLHDELQASVAAALDALEVSG